MHKAKRLKLIACKRQIGNVARVADVPLGQNVPASQKAGAGAGMASLARVAANMMQNRAPSARKAQKAAGIRQIKMTARNRVKNTPLQSQKTSSKAINLNQINSSPINSGVTALSLMDLKRKEISKSPAAIILTMKTPPSQARLKKTSQKVEINLFAGNPRNPESEQNALASKHPQKAARLDKTALARKRMAANYA